MRIPQPQIVSVHIQKIETVRTCHSKTVLARFKHPKFWDEPSRCPGSCPLRHPSNWLTPIKTSQKYAMTHWNIHPIILESSPKASKNCWPKICWGQIARWFECLGISQHLTLATSRPDRSGPGILQGRRRDPPRSGLSHSPRGRFSDGNSLVPPRWRKKRIGNLENAWN